MPENTYFLGASTPDGFYTPIGELLSDTSVNIYILKGTAGSGKSTLMKKISGAFSECDRDIYRCSADPDSLDAVYIKEKKALIMDGTSPHCTDPRYPKAVDSIIDLGAYLEGAVLRENKKDIIELTDNYADYHKRCRQYLSAISSVMTDIRSAASHSLKTNKVSASADNIARRTAPKKGTEKLKGKLYHKQLSALTRYGYMTYLPEGMEIYMLDDEYIAASDMFLRRLADNIIGKGYDVIVSECLMCRDRFYEHIIIPELNTAFISSFALSGSDTDRIAKKIKFRRFYDTDIFDKNNRLCRRLKFDKKAALTFMEEAASEMDEAKKVHDEIEKYYISAADFDGINRLTYKLISEIKSLA